MQTATYQKHSWSIHHNAEVQYGALLSDAKQIIIKSNVQTVASSVLAHYQHDGWHGAHSENWLWNSLFGLLMWDIIYSCDYGPSEDPYDSSPSDIYQPDFYLRKKDAIEERLGVLEYVPEGLNFLKTVYEQKKGTLNPFIRWDERTLPLIQKLLYCIPEDTIADVIRHMAKDVMHRKGFPDLFLWRGRDYRLIKIKSSNDQLSAQQYKWIEFFIEQGIDAQVLKVNVTRNLSLYG